MPWWEAEVRAEAEKQRGRGGSRWTRSLFKRNEEERGLGNEEEQLEARSCDHRGKPGAHLAFTGSGQVLNSAYCQ